MKYAKILGLGLLATALAVTGCTEKGSPPKAETRKDASKKEDHAPHGKGPNGGVVFDLGKYHAEFTVDHDKKECTILILGADEKTPTAVASKEFTLTTKQTQTKEGTVVPPMTIKMLPKEESGGKASKFVGTDPGLGNVADFEGTVIGEIDGKPSQGTFKEE
ncbi:MAG: hypothetical protein L0Z62_14835 [Gemmataceae bacterium]|nr:hypothetical protein [Gemmataceae bacterium]